jgi:hypothetical protein
MIEVHLYGDLRRFAADSAFDHDSIAWVEWQRDDTVDAVLRRIGVDHTRDVSNVFVNGVYTYNAGRLGIADAVRLGVFPKNICALYI